MSSVMESLLNMQGKQAEITGQEQLNASNAMKLQETMRQLERDRMIMQQLQEESVRSSQQAEAKQVGQYTGALDSSGSPLSSMMQKQLQQNEALRKATLAYGTPTDVAAVEKSRADLLSKAATIGHAEGQTQQITRERESGIAHEASVMLDGHDWDGAQAALKQIPMSKLKPLGFEMLPDGNIIPTSPETPARMKAYADSLMKDTERVSEQNHLATQVRNTEKDKLEAASRSLDDQLKRQHIEANRQRLRDEKDADKAALGLTPEARNVNAIKKAIFDIDPKVAGRDSVAYRKQVANDAAAWATNPIEQGGLGLTPLQAAMLPSDNKTKQIAVGKLQQWGASVGRSAQQLDQSIDLVIDYSKKMTQSELQTVNKAILAGKAEFNNPGAVGYALQVNTVRTEYARLMSGPTSNAMLPVDAAKHADELISKGLTTGSWLEVKKVLKRDAAIGVQSVQDQQNMLRMSMVPGSGDTGLSPGTPSGPGTVPSPSGGVKKSQSAPSASGLTVGNKPTAVGQSLLDKYK